ncbi:MAG TPA: hypothetical protein VGE40_01880 [Bacilli bacterium]
MEKSKRKFRGILPIISSMVCVCLMMSSCGSNRNDQQTKIDQYNEDGYLGLSNSNPNLRTSPTHYTYNEDTKVIRMTLAGIRGVRGSTIFLSAPNAYVRVRVSRGLSVQESREIEEKAIAALSYNLPRYKVFIRIVPISTRG